MTTTTETVSPRRILYIDEDRDFGQLLAWALGQFGHQVSTFSEPKAALRAISLAPWDWDLVISALGGVEPAAVNVVNAIRQLRPDLQCALLSGGADSDIGHAAALPCLAPIIRKPACMQQFAALGALAVH
jgi:DNA-binding NtrC family response regulator